MCRRRNDGLSRPGRNKSTYNGGRSDQDRREFWRVDKKQQALVHFSFLLMSHHAPESVLSIGLGTGILIGEVSRHPSVSELDCLEIVPTVVEGAEYFTGLTTIY